MYGLAEEEKLLGAEEHVGRHVLPTWSSATELRTMVQLDGMDLSSNKCKSLQKRLGARLASWLEGQVQNN